MDIRTVIVRMLAFSAIRAGHIIVESAIQEVLRHLEERRINLSLLGKFRVIPGGKVEVEPTTNSGCMPASGDRVPDGT